MLKKILKTIFVYIPLCFMALSITLVLIYKWIPVTCTPLMLIRTIQNMGNDDYRTAKKWMDIECLSPNIIKAVMASEDSRFLQHHGFDFEELGKMLEDHQEKGKKIRGCSTISQQTAKNCFTFCTRTWFRKGIEAYYTVLIELLWGKKRIMEVYLNVVETGKGIFGMEAASLKYFGMPASELTLRQAAQLACILPNPLVRTPASVASRMTGRLSLTMKRASQIRTGDLVSPK